MFCRSLIFVRHITYPVTKGYRVEYIITTSSIWGGIMQTVTQKTLEDTMYYGDIPVFIYQIHYPFFTTTCNETAGRDINAYYAKRAMDTEEYCRNILFAQAAEDKRYHQDGLLFNSYTLEAVYQITYNAGCITSLYTDTYTYMGGAHGETKRTSDTWDFMTGNRLKLADVYPLTPASLYQLHRSIARQIAHRLSETPGSYFVDYRSLLKDAFNVNRFYLRPGSGVIYYQQYDIAPYSTGIPEFYFPLR